MVRLPFLSTLSSKQNTQTLTASNKLHPKPNNEQDITCY